MPRSTYVADEGPNIDFHVALTKARVGNFTAVVLLP